MSDRKRTTDSTRQNVILAAVSLLTGVMVTTAGMLLLGKLVERSSMTLQDAVLPVTLLGVVGSFTAGYCMTKLTRFHGLVCGLCSGGFFTAVFAAAVLINGIQTVTWYTPLKILCFLLGGMFGGAVASVKPSHNRHKR